MAASLFAVVYGTHSKIVRRFVFPDGDPDDLGVLRAALNLQPGESIVFLRLADFPMRPIFREHVQHRIGTPMPEHSYYAVHRVTGERTGPVVVDTYDPRLNPFKQHDLIPAGEGVA